MAVHKVRYMRQKFRLKSTFATTEETEKLELTRLTEKLDGNIELAIRQLAENKRQENKQSFNP